MRKAIIILMLFLSPMLHAQSLTDIWIPYNSLLLSMGNFSMTFNDNSTYRINCVFGETLGTYVLDEGKIFFTPTKVGIKSGDDRGIGDIDIYTYRFINDNVIYLSGGGNSLTLIRRDFYEKSIQPKRRRL